MKFKLFDKNIIKKKHKDFNHLNGNRLLNYYLSRENPELIAWYMRKLFFHNNKYYPNFDKPESFNEKIHWLKLNYHNSLITKCCDKFKVKEYSREVLGKDICVPTIASWTNVNNINFDKLPNKFVLKVNWSSGYNIIVKDKTTLNINEIKHRINQWMQPYNNSYYVNFNWGYKDMKPVIYAEEYLDELDKDLPDYKFLCYNGEPKNLFVVSNRFKKMKVDFFDMDWNHLPFKRKHPTSKNPPKKPENFEQMVEIARKLSKPFPFVRVDIYSVKNKLYIGELTFVPGGGLEPFTPVEWDYKFGKMLTLPNQKEI